MDRGRPLHRAICWCLPIPRWMRRLRASAAAGSAGDQCLAESGQAAATAGAGHRRARNILEIGTLGGYSTIWLARALPAGGRLISLEADAKHAEVARANIARAGLADMVELRLGLALDLLPRLAAERAEPFDFIFIDADKPNNAGLLRLGAEALPPGSLIVVDNVVRDGR